MAGSTAPAAAASPTGIAAQLAELEKEDPSISDAVRAVLAAAASRKEREEGQTQECAKQVQTQIQPQDQMQLQLFSQQRLVPEPDGMPVDDDESIVNLFEGVVGLTSEQRGMLEDNAKKKLRR